MVERAEEIFQALLDSGIAEEELMAQVKEKETEFQGFMTKQAILYLIAKENGVNVDPSENAEILEAISEDVIDYNDFAISISSVTENMSNIVIAGRITEVYGKNDFLRKDGTPGTVGSFQICDLSDCIKVVLWNDQTEIMDNRFLQKREIIQVVGAYSKKGLKDKLELHLGRQGKIVLAPKGVILPEVKTSEIKKVDQKEILDKKVDKASSNFTLKELHNKEGFIRFTKGVVQIREFKELTLKNGEKSFLLKLVLSDETASITVNIWGLKAVECVKMIEDGISIKLINMILKENSYLKEKELSSTKSTILEVI
jgi:ssDNA-binding replication factor A large subunit